MECRYCQAGNAEDDHRCRRCGRRLRLAPVYTASATAPALDYDVHENASLHATAREAAPAPTPAHRPITYQPSLFTSRELPRVVPFESIAPGVIEAPPRKAPSHPRTRPRKIVPGQQSLEFLSARARVADGVIYCDAPVAIPMHRAMAAAMDASMIVIALALFALVFRFTGGQIHVTTKMIPVFFAIVAGLTLFYKLLWCVSGGDTPGMKWTHLALVDFDGHAPTRRQRLQRLASGFLSVLAAGIGVLWALVDEETLTWHDHISRTFPTPR
jgi:uncharacterized RDD family membrane protein YckC